MRFWTTVSNNLFAQVHLLRAAKDKDKFIEFDEDEYTESEEDENFDVNEWHKSWTDETTKLRKEESDRQISKDEKEYDPSSVCLEEDDNNDVPSYSGEESLDCIDYDNAHLAFDPEKSHKFNF